MLKPTANYKMSKQTKRTLALTSFDSQDQRNAWKRSMIQAELAALIQPKREKGRRQDSKE
jgi:hypothetical protein